MTSYINKNWSNSDFHGANFRQNSFVNCNFSNCDFMSCDFDQASLVNCNFSNSDLLSSSFIQATLTNCTFSSCELLQTRFTSAVLTNTRFPGTSIDAAIDLKIVDSSDSFGENSSVVSFGNQVIQQNTSFSSVSGAGSVRLVSGGISEIDLHSWIRVFNEGHAYRIEIPGANIRVSGTYTFVNRDKFMYTEVTHGGCLNVSVGKISRGDYQETSFWELTPNAWCEVLQEDFSS